ncbi:hypothetical protein scyTo_0010097 [Scyliorhinus torazame]|uniref:Uncharacterized protein n=1 Tax=Scyliorhinus torazame TaxID=75743 RepID=A0A401NZW9_SCYTO|nr:hypothetical protein [Scyliorhinus torazame]
MKNAIRTLEISVKLSLGKQTAAAISEVLFRWDNDKFKSPSDLLVKVSSVSPRIHTEENPFACEVKLARNTQERSLTGEQVLYIKELTEQEEFTRKLFGLSNPTITNGGSDMGMSEDTRVSMDTSDGDGGELAAAPEIPERADEEGTEVNTSQQCGMAAEVEECQECKVSDLEGSVGEFKLNIVACVKEEVCDDLADVVKGGHSGPSGCEEPATLETEAPPSPRVHGQHQAHGEENEDNLKNVERLHQEQVQSTESYQATSNLLRQTLTEFKTDVNQNLQKNTEILQHLQRNTEILQQQNEVLRQQNEIQNQHLQRTSEILQQKNVILCQLLQRSNETLNEMRQILSQIVVPAPSSHQQPSAETSAEYASCIGEVTSQGQERHNRRIAPYCTGEYGEDRYHR